MQLSDYAHLKQCEQNIFVDRTGNPENPLEPVPRWLGNMYAL